MLLSPGDVREALRELAIELRDDGLTARIRVVGGAAVSIRVGREALTRERGFPVSYSDGFRSATVGRWAGALGG